MDGWVALPAGLAVKNEFDELSVALVTQLGLCGRIVDGNLLMACFLKVVC